MTSNEFNEDLAPDLAETADRLRRARQTLEGLRPRFERIADQSLARALDTPNPVAASSWTSRRPGLWAAACLLVMALPMFWFAFGRPGRQASSTVGNQDLSKLVSDLKCERAEVREKAQTELQRKGSQLRSRVKEALEAETDEEARSRLRRVLAVYDWQDLADPEVGIDLASARDAADRVEVLVRHENRLDALGLREARKAALAEAVFRGSDARDQMAVLERAAKRWSDEEDLRDHAWILLPLLKAADDDVLYRAVVLLMNQPALKNPDLAPRIAALLESPSPTLRGTAIAVLRRLKAVNQAAAIAKRLSDPESVVRATAIQALGEMGSKEFAPQVAERLTDQDAAVRVWAVDILGGFGDAAYSPGVVKMTEDPDPDVRGHALYALGSVGGAEHLPKFEQALGEQGPGASSVRLGVVNGLRRFMDRGIDSRPLAPLVVGLLQDRDGGIRLAGVSLLQKFRAKEHVHAVEALIDDPEAWVRQGVAAFLGELGDRESLAVLRRRIDREREAQTAPALKAAAAALEKRLGQ